MDRLIAHCGLNCGSCPIHIATLEQERSMQHSMRISIAEQCNEHYGMRMLPEEINDCDGCRMDTGRLFSACANCRIRECASSKGLETCADCDEFACNELLAMFRLDPEAKRRLEEMI